MASAVGVQSRLILHFDVNETIMVGDPAGGDTFEDCLQKIICKQAYVKLPDGVEVDRNKGDYKKLKDKPTHWYDGTPLDSSTPPELHTAWEWPAQSVPAYRHGYFKDCKKTFADEGNPGNHRDRMHNGNYVPSSL